MAGAAPFSPPIGAQARFSAAIAEIAIGACGVATKPTQPDDPCTYSAQRRPTTVPTVATAAVAAMAAVIRLADLWSLVGYAERTRYDQPLEVSGSRHTRLRTTTHIA